MRAFDELVEKLLLTKWFQEKLIPNLHKFCNQSDFFTKYVYKRLFVIGLKTWDLFIEKKCSKQFIEIELSQQ